MTFDELKNGMKSLFFSLGAKTSDSNYAVGLYDKTSAEPKGLMGMSDLASVLGVPDLKNTVGAIDSWDLNSQHKTSMRFARNNCTHTPSTGFFIVLTFEIMKDSNCIQFAFSWMSNEAYYRIARDDYDWQSWYRVTSVSV